MAFDERERRIAAPLQSYYICRARYVTRGIGADVYIFRCVFASLASATWKEKTTSFFRPSVVRLMYRNDLGIPRKSRLKFGAKSGLVIDRGWCGGVGHSFRLFYTLVLNNIRFPKSLRAFSKPNL